MPMTTSYEPFSEEPEYQAANRAFVESVPLTQPFTVTLSVPEEPVRVRLQPGDREPEWSYSEGTLTVVVPPFHIHAILEVL